MEMLEYIIWFVTGAFIGHLLVQEYRRIRKNIRAKKQDDYLDELDLRATFYCEKHKLRIIKDRYDVYHIVFLDGKSTDQESIALLKGFDSLTTAKEAIVSYYMPGKPVKIVFGFGITDEVILPE